MFCLISKTKYQEPSIRLSHIQLNGTKKSQKLIIAYVNEANLRGLLTEATSAKHKIVLSNQTTAVTAGTAT